MPTMLPNPVWSGFAEGYRNNRYIADLVLPRVPVAAELFECDYYDIPEFLVAPNNEVGRLDRPPLVDFKASQRQFRTKNYAMDSPLPQFDLDLAKAQRQSKITKYDPEKMAMDGIAELHELARERRVAGIMSNPLNYLPSMQQVLAGPSQFTDPASRPKDLLMAIMDGMLYRPNKAAFSRLVWTALRSHPQIVAAVLGNAGSEGVATVEQVAKLLELDEILVGDSFAAISQNRDPSRPAEMVNRIWGNDVALFYSNPAAQAIAGYNQFTFGYTARLNGVEILTFPDNYMGAGGGQVVRIRERCIELITGKFCGYLLRNVIPASTPFSMDRVM